MEGHTPVLKTEILQTFKDVCGMVCDGTFGGGGHSEALLKQTSSLYIAATDVDPEAAERSEYLKKEFPTRFEFFQINFSEISNLHRTFDGVVLDLGVSSFQLETPKRGFSFRTEGPLDMRMNPNVGLSARDFLKKASPEALTQAIREYGEEPQWQSVVQGILQHRERENWETTTDFVSFLERHTSIAKSKKPNLHSATRVFQGLRIAVNNELNHLKCGLEAAFECLNTNGLLAVITFHSLEDRIVKRHFYDWCGRSLTRDDAKPRQLKTIRAVLMTRKPVMATEAEIVSNPRSRSAKLRILKKL